MKIGIYQRYWGRLGGGQRYVGVVAEMLAREHNVEIVHHCETFDRKIIEEGLDVDLSRVCFRYLPQCERPTRSSWRVLRRLKMERQWGCEVSRPYDLFIDSSDVPPFFCHAERGVLLIHFPLIGFEEFHGRNTEAWRNCSRPRRMVASIFHRLEWHRRFRTYERCIVNSEFTRRWIKRLWGLEAEVVYPPLRDGVRAGRKLQQILTIGAFSSSGHKKHSLLIDAFRQLCESGIRNWRYVFAGACSESAEDRAYVSRLREYAAGLPVEIHTNLTGTAINKLLSESSILWHAMGHGIDEQSSPHRMEHFGMVATEAQAAGAVPIVFCGGGLPEIVTPGRDGFLWSTIDELVEYSAKLALEPEMLKLLSEQSRQNVRRFTRPIFESRLRQVLLLD